MTSGKRSLVFRIGFGFLQHGSKEAGNIFSGQWRSMVPILPAHYTGGLASGAVCLGLYGCCQQLAQAYVRSCLLRMPVSPLLPLL